MSLDMTALEVLVTLASYDHPKNPMPYLPFYDPRKRKVGTSHLPPQETWILSCMNLGPDGRGMDYENRPHFPCGSYAPGEDPLCAQAVRKIGLCPDLKQPTPDFETFRESRRG
jgi:hypothetical protein